MSDNVNTVNSLCMVEQIQGSKKFAEFACQLDATGEAIAIWHIHPIDAPHLVDAILDMAMSDMSPDLHVVVYVVYDGVYVWAMAANIGQGRSINRCVMGDVTRILARGAVMNDQVYSW